jgi:16S rRNA processing protein RimM
LKAVSPEDLILVGKVTKPHGLNGLMRVYTYAQSVEPFQTAETVFLKSGTEGIAEYKISSVQPHKNILLMKLDGINSINDAEKCRGFKIFMRKEALPLKDEDEYYWFELIGLKVYLDSGKYLGELQDILETRSNDIYVVREGKSEIMIPAIHDVVKEIDLINKRMTISEMEGLLDINAV